MLKGTYGNTKFPTASKTKTSLDFCSSEAQVQEYAQMQICSWFQESGTITMLLKVTDALTQ